MVPKG
jgi:hypothetical protein